MANTVKKPIGVRYLSPRARALLNIFGSAALQDPAMYPVFSKVRGGITEILGGGSDKERGAALLGVCTALGIAFIELDEAASKDAELSEAVRLLEAESRLKEVN